MRKRGKVALMVRLMRQILCPPVVSEALLRPRKTPNRGTYAANSQTISSGRGLELGRKKVPEYIAGIPNTTITPAAGTGSFPIYGPRVILL